MSATIDHQELYRLFCTGKMSQKQLAHHRAADASFDVYVRECEIANFRRFRL